MENTKAAVMKLRIPINTITVIALCIASSKIQVLSSAFIYDRNAIWRGEIWRLVTSHFVHFSGIHLIYNLIAFSIVGWIIESKGYKHFKLLYFITACSISAVLLAVKPDMIYFGGLSGVACGFYIYCALLCLHEHPPWRTISILSLIFISAKLGCELYSDGSILPYWGAQDFIPVPISHIAGSISALVLFLLIKRKVIEEYLSSRTRPDADVAIAIKAYIRQPGVARDAPMKNRQLSASGIHNRRLSRNSEGRPAH